MNSDGLKNCPVCNSTNVIPYYDMCVDEWEAAYVWCRTCRTPGPKCKNWHEQHALWNAVERNPDPPAFSSLSLNEGKALSELQVEVSVLRAANKQLQGHFDRFEAAEINRKAK